MTCGSTAIICSACWRGTMTAGPDGFRDPVPNSPSASKARTLTGFSGSSVRPIVISMSSLTRQPRAAQPPARRVASWPRLGPGSFGRLVTAEAVRQFRIAGDRPRSTAQHHVSERQGEPFTASRPTLQRGGAVKPRRPEGAPQAQGLRAPPRCKTIEDAVNRELMCLRPWARALPPSRIQFFSIITDWPIPYSLPA